MRVECPHCKKELDVQVSGLEPVWTILNAIAEAIKAYYQRFKEAPDEVHLGAIRAWDFQRLNPDDLADDQLFRRLMRDGACVFQDQTLFGLTVNIDGIEVKETWDALEVIGPVLRQQRASAVPARNEAEVT